MKHAMTLCFPDYKLDWALRTDACNVGYGGVLYQLKILESGEKQYQVIKFMSKKWHDAATR